jgi:hypothetical protein
VNIDELRTKFSVVYRAIFDLGVAAERRKREASELIVAGSAESRAREINRPAVVVARSRVFREGVAQAKLLRSEVARHLAL